MANSSNESEKFQDTLLALKMSLQESWGYFVTVTSLDDWFSRGNQFNVASPFFYLVNESCIRASIATLAGLIANNKNTVNIHYFLNIANDLLSLFQFPDKLTIKRTIQKHREWLAGLNKEGAIGNRIIDKRDKMIAHLDRKYVTQKKTKFLSDNPPIKRNEIEDIYRQLMNVINEMEAFYYNYPFVKNDLDTDIRDSIDYIFALIENRPR